MSQCGDSPSVVSGASLWTSELAHPCSSTSRGSQHLLGVPAVVLIHTEVWELLTNRAFLELQLTWGPSTPAAPGAQWQGVSICLGPGKGTLLFKIVSVDKYASSRMHVAIGPGRKLYKAWLSANIYSLGKSDLLKTCRIHIIYYTVFLFTSGGAWKPQELFLVSGVCTLQSQLGQCALRCLESQSPSRNPEHGCLSAFHDDFAGKGSSVGWSNSKSGELWSAVAS